MKRAVACLTIAYSCGAIMGAGLIVSGMTQPAKIQGFLDLFGVWDPSLVLVIGAAVPVSSIAFALVRYRGGAILSGASQRPNSRELTLRLLLGSACFGSGWALGGYCPGPAIASLPDGRLDVLLFVAAMLTGMWLFQRIEQHDTRI